jgi:hypothetical protein
VTQLNQHSATATPPKTSDFFFQESKNPQAQTQAITLSLFTPEATVALTIFQIILSMEETSITMQVVN